VAGTRPATTLIPVMADGIRIPADGGVSPSGMRRELSECKTLLSGGDKKKSCEKRSSHFLTRFRMGLNQRPPD
jgi:hypothetical protein